MNATNLKRFLAPISGNMPKLRFDGPESKVFPHQEIGDAVPNVNARISEQRFFFSFQSLGPGVLSGRMRPWNLGTM